MREGGGTYGKTPPRALEAAARDSVKPIGGSKRRRGARNRQGQKKGSSKVPKEVSRASTSSKSNVKGPLSATLKEGGPDERNP